jgi:ATP-dependent protease HslVU (ClpYQ) ATPase subunit
VYNLTGDNARLYFDSVDNSNNVVKKSNDHLFQALREEIIAKIDNNRILLQLVDEMKQSVGTSTFQQKYISFISSAADHISVISSFIPALTKFLPL